MSASEDQRNYKIIGVGVVLLLLMVVTVGAGVAPLIGGIESVAASTGQNDESATIENVTLAGEGFNETQYDIVANHPGPAYVWQDSELRLNVTVESHGDSGTFYVCGQAYSEDSDNSESSVSFDCERFSMSEESTQTISLGIESWPENATGNHTIIVDLYKSGVGDNVAVDDTVVKVSVIERDGDLTGDGLKNEEEFEHGTDLTQPDTSGDGLTDWEEVKKYETNPLEPDTTGDGVADATLIRLGLDPTVPYLLHRYVAGGLLTLLVILGGATLVVQRRRGETASDGDWSTAPEEDRSEANHDGNGERPDTNEQVTIDESILTNQEVVCRLLEQNGGRMRQGQFVESTEWSKAKVSRVLSGLEEDGVIQRIRIGRENVVDLKTDDIEVTEPKNK